MLKGSKITRWDSIQPFIKMIMSKFLCTCKTLYLHLHISFFDIWISLSFVKRKIFNKGMLYFFRLKLPFFLRFFFQQQRKEMILSDCFTLSWLTFSYTLKLFRVKKWIICMCKEQYLQVHPWTSNRTTVSLSPHAFEINLFLKLLKCI